MAKCVYVNKEGTSNKTTKIYVNVDGTSRKVKKIYTNVGGTSKLAYTATQNIAVPSQSRSLTYNGNPQSPIWNGYDVEKMTISGDTVGTNAGTYTVKFTTKDGWQFSDGITEKTVNWSIGRKAINNTPSQSGRLTYNGGDQSPVWSNYDSSQLTLSGTTTRTNAGSYTAIFTPKSNYMWSDGSIGAKNITWTIEKDSCSSEVSTYSLSFTSFESKNVTVTRSGNGTIHAESSNIDRATCSVSGNVVTITPVATSGSCYVDIYIGADANHTASVRHRVSVTLNVVT